MARRVLPIVPWLVAIVLGGTLGWAAPRASESRKLEADIAALRPRVLAAEADASTAATVLAETRIALANAQAARDDLAESAKSERSLVSKLRKRIRGMEKRIADLEAAAASAAAAPSVAPSTAVTTPPIQPFPGPDPVCYQKYNPETKKWEEICE